MNNLVLYGRVAVAGQQDAGTSREGQPTRCLAYIESRGRGNVAVYADDAQGDAG